MGLPMRCIFLPIEFPTASPTDLFTSHGKAHGEARGEAHGTQQQVLWEVTLFQCVSWNPMGLLREVAVPMGLSMGSR